MERVPLVLVVDDDPSIRYLLAQLVTGMGLRAAGAADGGEALARVDEEPPTAVLLDLMMPVLDGFEVCRRLKANPTTRTIPIVAVSAGANRAQALACGCDDFVAKPFDLAQIEEVLGRWLVHLV